MKHLVARKVDTQLLLLIIGLVCFGIVMIYSASVVVGHLQFEDSRHFVKKQIVSAIIGIVALAVTASIDYRVWKKWAGILFMVTLLLLISVFFLSRGEINGAHRWIDVGGLRFQPSELTKLTFVIYTAAWCSERKDSIRDIKKTFLPFLAVLIVISLLILKQPDFGTLTIILASAISVYFAAGMSLQQGLLGLGGAGIAAYAISVTSPYRLARILAFLNPTSDTQGISYHIKNIALAIGSGGLWGLGFGESKQKRLFLPEPHTDSIFAVITEELGFVRSTLVLALLAYIIYRCYKIAMQAPDMFSRLVATGITTWFAYQTLINLGSMVHAVPLVGVPLPFVSYGGTNLSISLMAVGILLSISRYRQEDIDEKPQLPRQKRIKGKI